ncbi:hypothetical protein ACF0H5_021257 [Mactra antiquata]
MRGFVFLAVLVAIVAVVQGLQVADRPKLDICMSRGNVGACLGPDKLPCQSPVTTCTQGIKAGLCCVNPDIPLVCAGDCGGIAGALCKNGFECVYGKVSSLGNCCKKTGQCPPPSELLGPCVIDPATSCINDLDCEGRKICCAEGCGKECMNPVGGPN